jgi:hypothetical protein
MHGHIAAALRLNPITTAGVAAGVLAFSHDAVRPGGTAFVRLVSRGASAPAIALAAVFGVLRNISWFN